MSRVIPDSSNLDLDWNEEDVVASLSGLSELDQKPRIYLLRALRLLLLSIDEKLPAQVWSMLSSLFGWHLFIYDYMRFISHSDSIK